MTSDFETMVKQLLKEFCNPCQGKEFVGYDHEMAKTFICDGLDNAGCEFSDEENNMIDSTLARFESALQNIIDTF